MRSLFTKLNQAVWKINPFNRRGSFHGLHIPLAVLCCATGPQEVAASLTASVLFACYEIVANGLATDDKAALYDNGIGPALNTTALVATGCVRPLNTTAACDDLFLNNTVVTMFYCSRDACASSFHTNVSPRYAMATNNSILFRCFNNTFPSGSNANVCLLPECSDSTTMPRWAQTVLALGCAGIVVTVLCVARATQKRDIERTLLLSNQPQPRAH